MPNAYEPIFEEVYRWERKWYDDQVCTLRILHSAAEGSRVEILDEDADIWRRLPPLSELSVLKTRVVELSEALAAATPKA